MSLKPPKCLRPSMPMILRDEWAKHWCPPDTSKASEAVANWAKWTAKEIIALQHHLTPLADELYQLWIDTPNSSNEDLPKSLIRKIWNWKVVGITKKSIFESRPISIASLLVRAWRKALLKNCPAAPTGQWCGRAKTSVVDATADFVAARPIHVAETDLTKAFDHLWPSLAEHAMIHNGVPPIIAKTLHRAWLGPRICTVGGLLAIEINPARGVPQGDPCSPLALSACLGVWTQIIEKIHPCLKTLAYMDDRTIAVVRQGTKNHLESALEATKDFDKKVGFQINPEKTQIWIKNESTGPIEHLGLTFDPARPEAPLGVRDPTKKEEAVARLHRCPGSCEVRAKLTTAFVRPLFDWASPLLPPGTIQEATNLFQAIAHSTVSWWCQPRFWAQQIENHPCFGVAIRGLCASYRVLNNKCPHIVKALDRHAKVLHLKIVSFQHDSLTIQSSDDSIVCGTTPGSHPGDFLQSFDLNEGNSRNLFELSTTYGSEPGELILNQICHTRFDAEGYDQINLDAYSSIAYKKITDNLSSSDLTCLFVWKSGAIKTPTRRFYKRPHEPESRKICPWCSFPRASARHFFVDCIRFEDLRFSLQNSHHIPPPWWANQPRCTSKSGWIVHQAALTQDQRVDCAIAVCKLGIVITKAMMSLDL